MYDPSGQEWAYRYAAPLSVAVVVVVATGALAYLWVRRPCRVARQADDSRSETAAGGELSP